MGRRRKAWLSGGDGVREDRGRRLPGYYVEWNDYRADGRRIHRTRQFLKLKHARQYCREFNAKHDLALIDTVVQIEYGEACRDFLAHLATQKDSTRTHYAASLGMFSTVAKGLDVARITGLHVDIFIQARLSGRIKKRKVSLATVRKDANALNAFFNWCVKKRNYAAVNPLTQATALPGRVHVRERPPMSLEIVSTVVEQLDTPDRKLAVQLAAMTGLDRSVIENLRPEMIDLEQRVLVHRRPKTRRHSAKVSTHYLHSSLVPALRHRVHQTPPGQRLLEGLTRQDSKKDWWKKAVKAAGCPDLLFRDLRAFASQHLQRELTLAETAQQLDHSTVEMTARHYTPPSPDVAAKIDRLPVPGSPVHPPVRLAGSA